MMLNRYAKRYKKKDSLLKPIRIQRWITDTRVRYSDWGCSASREGACTGDFVSDSDTKIIF